MSERERANKAVPVTGMARVDKRTKRLVKRVQPGDVMVIDHADLDRVAAETIIEAQAGAVVNAAASITGRYPNVGPLLLCAAGIPLVDQVGSEAMQAITEGRTVTVAGDRVRGRRQLRRQAANDRPCRRSRRASKRPAGRWATSWSASPRTRCNTSARSATSSWTIPTSRTCGLDMKGRHVLVVVRGPDYKDDLRILRRSGYLSELKPLLVGVDGGADALLEMGWTPDLIIGDMDSVSEDALRCGAALVVHGYEDGRAPGADRLTRLGLDHAVWSMPGTSEDIAMLLAYEKGAELIVAVGTHSSMVEFLDKGRGGHGLDVLGAHEDRADPRRRQGREPPLPAPGPQA